MGMEGSRMKDNVSSDEHKMQLTAFTPFFKTSNGFSTSPQNSTTQTSPKLKPCSSVSSCVIARFQNFASDKRQA